MLKDQRELLSALNAHGVEYLVVGGHAAIAYGVARLTKDLDVFVRADEANSHRVYAALAAFGAPMAALSPADFYDRPSSVIQFGVPPSRIDILQSIEGVSFEDAWRNHVDVDIEDGLVVHYIAVDDLIRNKETAGRLQDLADIGLLRKMRNLE